MRFCKVLLLFAIAAVPMFADAVVFTFGGSNSSLTLGQFALSPVIGAGAVTAVQRAGFTPYALSAEFAFVTGSRGPVSTVPLETVQGGGGWAIFGSGTVNSETFTNELLIAGVFGNNAGIANTGVTNVFGSSLIVATVNPYLLAALGLQDFVAVSTFNQVGFDRPGTWNASNFSFRNGPSGLNAPYNGSLTFEGIAAAVPEPFELALLAAGFAVVLLRRGT